MVFTAEKLDGIWTRNLVAGVTVKEIFLSQIAVNLMVVLLQSTEIILALNYLFYPEILMNNLLVYSLVILQFLPGMACGFFISTLSDSYRSSVYGVNSVFGLAFLMGGVVWPVETQPPIMRFLTNCFPFVVPAKAMRDILFKGFTIWDTSVISAFGIIITWTAFFLSVSLIIIKIRK
jgi:ABC-type polysaccharide/polyol phosphate export permease